MIYGSSVAVGILLAILAAAIGTTSKQLIAASEHYKRPWLFHLGAGMNVALGPIVDASAYAFAPQVVVAPFACLDVIFNVMTAPFTLSWQNERITKTHLVGTGCVALGAVMTSVFANVDNKVYNVQELEAQLFFRPTSLVYLSLELLAIGSANVALRKKLLSPQLRGISLGVIAGVLMGNVFFMKGLIGLIQTSAETGDFSAWIRPTPYILTACAAGGAIYGHVVMRKGLGEYKGVFMVTIFEGAHISAACFSGCVVMEELAGYPAWQYTCYWASVALVICGMMVMNIAANSAQIEGKGRIHHMAQMADVPLEEAEHVEASPKRKHRAAAHCFGRLTDDDPPLGESPAGASGGVANLAHDRFAGGAPRLAEDAVGANSIAAEAGRAKGKLAKNGVLPAGRQEKSATGGPSGALRAPELESNQL